MSRTRIKVGLRFKLFEKIYRIAAILHDGSLRVIGETFHEELIFTQSHLAKELNSGNLVFEVQERNSIKNNNEVVFESIIDDSVYEQYKDEAIFKFNVIKPFVINENSCKSRKDITEWVKNVNSLENNKPLLQEMFESTYFSKVSVSSVYRWIKHFQQSDRDISSLIPRYVNCGGPGKHRLHPCVTEIIQEEMDNFSKLRLPIVDLYDRISDRIDDFNEFSNEKLKKPSYETITRHLKSLSAYETLLNQIGKRSADNEFEQVNGGVKVKNPFERVEIDGTPLDLIVTDESGEPLGRPTFILAIDKLTRYPAGFSLSFGYESWQDVMLCIRHIIMDKSYVKDKYPNIENEWLAFGVPETIVVDNGLGFKNNSMKDACLQLGIDLQFCPPRTPQWKGSIERFFKTVSTKLIHKLPGTTRSNPSELGDNENPSKDACITLTTLVMLLHEWVIDKYAQKIHKSICEKPAELWKSEVSQHPVAWPNNINELVILLGKIERRKLKKTGIELMWLHYNSRDLNNLFKKIALKNIKNDLNFKIKYDPYNINNIYIFDHLIDKVWIKVPSTCPSYTENLSECEHKLACKRLHSKAKCVTIEGLTREYNKIKKELNESEIFSKRQVAKVKGYNSSTIISSSNSVDDSNDVYDKSANNQYKNSISDIGTLYNDDSNSVIVPEENIKVSTNLDEKKSSRKMKKANKKNLNEDISRDKIDEFDLDNVDLSEFRVFHIKE